MRTLFLIIIAFIASGDIGAQHINAHVLEANNLYKQKKFDKALPEYQKSVEEGATDPVTNYNLANAYFRNAKFEQAAAAFNETAEQANEEDLKQRAYYNQGVAYSKQQKLEESIKVFKKAVVMNPADEDARVNLQKALLELKKKQPPEQQKKNEKKDQQKSKDQKKQPQSNLTKKQVEQLLKALQQREQQVQQKMQQNRTRSSGQQEKDW